MMLLKTTKIQELVAELTAASAAYYNDGVSPLTDAEFDRKFDELRELDPENELFQTVGAPPSSERVKITHKHQMLSLNKATTSKELAAFLDKAPEEDYVVIQPKVDGAPVELWYSEGKLQWAATRGDGTIGVDVTVAARKALGVPAEITFQGDLSVRGEVFLPLSKWAEIDPEKKTNTRNVGTGILGRLDGSDAEKLSFLAFSATGLKKTLESGTLAMLNLLDFTPVETIQLKRSDIKGIERVIESLRTKRSSLDYAIDGAVVKYDSIWAQELLGASSGHPRGQIAYKWKSPTVNTVLTGVTFTVGHTGYIAPTANLEPVQLMGVTVSNALLNNWEEINRLDVAVGDTVIVERAGEIIPKIIGVAHRPADRKPIIEPLLCPECGGACARAISTTGDSGAVTICTNGDCPSRTRGLLKRWVKSLNILGIGDDLLVSMIDSGLLSNRVSFYNLDLAQLSQVRLGHGVLGEKRAKNIISEVNKTRNSLTIDKFVGSLGVPYLGVRKATIMKGLAKGKLDTIEAWMSNDLVACGAEVQAAGTVWPMHEFIKNHSDEIKELADICLAAAPAKLLGQPTNIVMFDDQSFKEPAAPSEAKVGSLVFLLTGKFENPKAFYHGLIDNSGHKYTEDFTKEVTHLVQADPNSSSNKTKKAVKSGIKVIGVDELVSLIS